MSDILMDGPLMSGTTERVLPVFPMD